MTTDYTKLKAAIITVVVAAIMVAFLAFKDTKGFKRAVDNAVNPKPTRALVVAVSGALIRTAPSTTAKKVGSLPFLAHVDVLGDNLSTQQIKTAEDVWLRVSSSSGDGWIWGNLLVPDTSPDYIKDVGPSHSDLEIIKRIDVAWMDQRVYIYNGIQSLVGITGKSEWKVLKPRKRIEGKKLMLVQALAVFNRVSLAKGKSSVELLLAVDMENGQHEILKATKDGSPMSKLEIIYLFGTKSGLD